MQAKTEKKLNSEIADQFSEKLILTHKMNLQKWNNLVIIFLPYFFMLIPNMYTDFKKLCNFCL